MADIFKVPLVLTAQSEGGYTVTSPVLPELLTEGDTLDEAVNNVRDALGAVVELYEDLGKPLPADVRLDPRDTSIRFEGLVTRP
ncbi:MAG: toxin-antitoxin system, antitoxin component, HicB family protein [Acidobacteria bacterium RIFCSPLOWO2_12_FULL_59_11]|nr:MAG: toxin-antitoxin system, antitoxin component, HicB family protein [Acidobacteria bacterium RIFCSPLOWO2_12_FULL_59_11]